MPGTTGLQDCAVIARAYERGAHFSSDEASVFAPLSRGVQNTRSFARNNQRVLKNYQITPKRDPQKQEGDILGKDLFIATPNPDFGKNLGAIAKDCLPCLDRILTAWSLKPEEAFYFGLIEDVKNRLNYLENIGDLFHSVDNTYGDLCALVSFLSKMCIIDLQKILFLLSALNMDLSIDLDGLMDFLQGLLAPLFAPLLTGLTSLLDHLIQLVVAPIDCMIEALGILIRDLDILTATGQVFSASEKPVKPEDSEQAGPLNLAGARRLPPAFIRQTVNPDNRPILTGALSNQGVVGAIQARSEQQDKSQVPFRSGLVEMQKSLIKGRDFLRNKIQFYQDAVNQLVGDWGFNDLAYTQKSFDRLINLRLIGLVKAMIEALSSGKPVCDPQTEKATPTELENFFNTFVSPNSPFQIRTDSAGNLVVTEKTEQPSGPSGPSVLPNLPKVIELEGDPLVKRIITPVNVTLRCSLKTSPDDISRVNKWMEELNTA